jgi:hypothetical protein
MAKPRSVTRPRRANNQPIFRTDNGPIKMAGFIDVAALIFAGVFPYTLSAGANPSVTLQNRELIHLRFRGQTTPG